MTTFGHIHLDNFDDEVQYNWQNFFGCYPGPQIVCGPVFVPNFNEHKARLPRFSRTAPMLRDQGNHRTSSSGSR